MALTKLPKNAFGTGSVDDTKIEDGTIQNQELAGSLSEDRLATGTIENASLSNSSVTINGTSISLGGSSSVGVDVNWQSVVTADGSTATTASAGNGYMIDTTSSAITATLPASPSAGDTIAIKDYAGTFGTNALTIGRNGNNIQGVANDSEISTNRASIVLVYIDATKGWLYTNESNVADLQLATYISATGGTITTSGDFKIHTFTGDGCFVVSQLGNAPTQPTGGPQTVSYLVIAGGGGGGGHAASNGGGGGAGGFREGRDITPSYTASPLVAPTGLTISTTTYPVTVGGGGTSCFNSTSGSNSVFSTITSAGGGGGSSAYPGSAAAKTGGSGGGGSSGACTSGAAGNTPPDSPPPGNNGGNGQGGCGYAGAGGGGAGAVGAQGGPNSYGSAGGAGGAGVTSHITGSPVTRAGGGGGFSYAGTAGAGGSGGGGNGARSAGSPAPTDTVATDGTANTGGGGGGRAQGNAGCGGGGGG